MLLVAANLRAKTSLSAISHQCFLPSLLLASTQLPKKVGISKRQNQLSLAQKYPETDKRKQTENCQSNAEVVRLKGSNRRNRRPQRQEKENENQRSWRTVWREEEEKRCRERDRERSRVTITIHRLRNDDIDGCCIMNQMIECLNI